MGNRAVITTRKDLKDIGVYLHWNGGRDSVEGFLTYCKIKGYRPPEYDNYGWAYLCTTIGNFFGQSGLSLGIDVASKLDCDNWDNGTYIIKDWKIVDRLYQSPQRARTCIRSWICCFPSTKSSRSRWAKMPSKQPLKKSNRRKPQMTIAQLHSKNFNDAAQELSENDDRITTYETLKEFAKENIDNDRLFLSIHILKAIWDNPADFYDYDYCMGTLDTPTPLLLIKDLEEYCEQEETEK